MRGSSLSSRWGRRLAAFTNGKIGIATKARALVGLGPLSNAQIREGPREYIPGASHLNLHQVFALKTGT